MVKQIDRGQTETFCVASECPTVREKSVIAACDRCGTGELRIIHSVRDKRFVGCSNYPQCDKSFPLPQRGLIVPTKGRCPACNQPIIHVIQRGRKPWVLCVNMDCPTKAGRKKAKAAPEGSPTRGFYTVVVAKQGDAWQVVSGRTKVAPAAN